MLKVDYRPKVRSWDFLLAIRGFSIFTSLMKDRNPSKQFPRWWVHIGLSYHREIKHSEPSIETLLMLHYGIYKEDNLQGIFIAKLPPLKIDEVWFWGEDDC